jgi:hypothetical protein
MVQSSFRFMLTVSVCWEEANYYTFSKEQKYLEITSGSVTGEGGSDYQ